MIPEGKEETIAELDRIIKDLTQELRTLELQHGELQLEYAESMARMAIVTEALTDKILKLEDKDDT